MDFKKEVEKILVKEKIPKELIQQTPNPEMGDYAVPCFILSKRYKKPPHEIAIKLANKIKNKYIEKVEANGPYLNFYIKRDQYNKNILTATRKKKNINKTIIIEFSSPNIMKPFSVAHLRSTMIGNAIYNLYNTMGYKTVRINHLGDWGTQFGKAMYAFEKWGDNNKLKKDPIKHILTLYVKFHKEAKKKPELEDKAREWFSKLEKGDKKAKTLWKKFRDLSIKEYNQIYKRLNVKFDSYAGEAFYEPYLKSTIKNLNKKGLLEESEGALIVDLEKYNMSPCILQKSDGSSIYATRDVAAAIYRYKEYKFAQNLYIVDARQLLHFNQFFKVLELANYKWAKGCKLISFGLMKFEKGVMSTRKGQIIFLDDVLDKSVQKVETIIKKKNPNLKNKKKVAEQVGIGAIVFWDLSHDRVKDLTFDWDTILDFEGETGPYVQYTYARASSILKKAKNKSKPDYGKLQLPEEKDLIKQLSLFEEIINKAASNYKPSILAKYIITVCQRFNEFYQKAHVLNEKDKNLSQARLVLVRKTRDTIKEGLNLLGIQAPERM